MAKQQKAVEEALSDLGLEGEYTRLIRLGVVNGWTMTEFLHRISSTRRFRREFPGLVQGGEINPGFGTTDLLEAVSRYRQMEFSYDQQAKEYGRKVGRGLLGALIRNNVAPEEFARRLSAQQTAKENPELRDLINQELMAFGKKPLDEMGFRRFLAGTSSRDFYDVFEAAYFRSAGLNLDAATARDLARSIGTPGALTDVNSIVGQVLKLRPDIGPELEHLGITDADLALAAAGQRPDLMPKLQGLIANRRAKGRYVAGTRETTGPGGGLALYPTGGAASAY